MHYFFERNLSEVKHEYTTFLVNIVAPLLYEGIKSVYNDSKGIHEELCAQARKDPDVNVLSSMQVFQQCLKEVPNYSNVIMEKETERIKNSSKCYEWFDDLVKAVIKSYILLLTFKTGQEKNVTEVMDKTHYSNVNVITFIHKCYIESAKVFYNNPDLFSDKWSSLDIKKNQNTIIEMIKDAIKMAVRKSLPMKLVLSEFLNNDQYLEAVKNCEKVERMIKQEVHGDDYNKFDDNMNSFDDNIDDEEDDDRSEEVKHENMREKIQNINNDLQGEKQPQHGGDDDSSSSSDDKKRIESSASDTVNKLNKEIDEGVMYSPIPVSRGHGEQHKYNEEPKEQKEEERNDSVKSEKMDNNKEYNKEQEKLKFFSRYLND